MCKAMTRGGGERRRGEKKRGKREGIHLLSGADVPSRSERRGGKKGKRKEKEGEEPDISLSFRIFVGPGKKKEGGGRVLHRFLSNSRARYKLREGRKERRETKQKKRGEEKKSLTRFKKMTVVDPTRRGKRGKEKKGGGEKEKHVLLRRPLLLSCETPTTSTARD